MKKLEDIEVLRAVAVLAVIWQHLDNLFPWQYPALRQAYTYAGGTFGVDLFFCISGFVIARDLVPRIQAAQAHGHVWRVAMAFWVKRMWRLWPAAWLWLALILLLAYGFNETGAFGSMKENIRSTWAALFNFYNIRFGQCFMKCGVGASFVYWSLSLEEQFYLVFPVLVIFLRRRLWILLTIAILFQLASTRSVWLMVFRSDAICMGVLIALASHKPYWRAVRQFVENLPKAIPPLVLIGSIGLMTSLSGELKWTTHPMSGISLTSAILVLLAAHPRHTMMQPGPFQRLLVAIGARSYGIYLAHIPIFFLTREIFHRLKLNLPATGSSVLISMAVATVLLIISVEIIYRYIENPLRHIGAEKSRNWLNYAAKAPQQTA